MKKLKSFILIYRGGREEVVVGYGGLGGNMELNWLNTSKKL